MNQEKIGKFIAACRKEKGLTQAALAEKLGITDRAVSKWENGRSMPDASIMLTLCELLGISVNELLTGEHIVMENYKALAEEKMIELQKSEQKSNKRILNLEIVLGVFSAVFMLVLILVTAYAGFNDTLTVVLTAVAIVQFLICIGICVAIEIKVGYYECPECGHQYIPTFNSYIWAVHIGWTRKMRCPKCGKKCWHKKVLTRR